MECVLLVEGPWPFRRMRLPADAALYCSNFDFLSFLTTSCEKSFKGVLGRKKKGMMRYGNVLLKGVKREKKDEKREARDKS